MTSRADGQNNVRSTTELIEPPPPPRLAGLPLLARVLLSEACVATDGRDPWKSISDWRGIGFHLATGNDPVPLAILRAIETFQETGKEFAVGSSRRLKCVTGRSQRMLTAVSTFNRVTVKIDTL